MIPPRHNADFVAHMEDVLEVYKRPLDDKYPVVCMDERPQQLIAETRRAIAARGGRIERYDYEYERCGTVALFLFVQPLAAWRKVSVRKQRTKVDWALEMEQLLEEDFPDAAQLILVCDNPEHPPSRARCMKPLSRTRLATWPSGSGFTTRPNMAVG